jgi:hypothetical protein
MLCSILSMYRGASVEMPISVFNGGAFGARVIGIYSVDALQCCHMHSCATFLDVGRIWTTMQGP